MNNVIRVEHKGVAYFYPDASVPDALIACYADVVRNDWDMERWSQYQRFLHVGVAVPHLRDEHGSLFATSVGLTPMLKDPPDQVRLSELLFHADVSVRSQIVKLALKPETEAVVMFEVLAMDSSQFGHRQFLAVGPDRSHKSVESVKNIWLGDVPSRFHYPRIWAANPTLKPKG